MAAPTSSPSGATSGGRSSSERRARPYPAALERGKRWDLTRTGGALAAARPMVQSVGRWASRRLDAVALDRSGQIPAEVLAEVGALGLFALRVPGRHGGLDLSTTETAALLMDLARFDRSVATTVGLHAGLGLEGLRRGLAPALAERWMPDLARGRAIAAFAATEAGAGSHIAGVATALTRGANGAQRLSGEKLYVTNGGVASIVSVLARCPEAGRRATGLLCVDTSAPGVRIGREERKLGLRASSTTPISFESVSVEGDDWLTEPGEGVEGLHRVLEVGRTFMAAGCLGTARRALSQTAEHVRERRQFGRRLADFELVRQRVGELSAWMLGVEALLWQVCDALDRGANASWESAALKVLASEVGWMAADHAVQLHGGAGYIEETGIPLLLRDSRVTRIFEGANEVLLVQLGAEVLRGARESGPRASVGRGGELERELDVIDDVASQALRSRRESTRTLALLGDQCTLATLGADAMRRFAARAALRWARRAGAEQEAELARAALLVDLVGARTWSAVAKLHDPRRRGLVDAAASQVLDS